jgi:glutamate synthase domain-containing protein 2
LKQRGYIVIPDPEDPGVQAAYRAAAFTEFERHSRLGMVDEEGFVKEVERIRGLGAKYVTLKTGSYRPVDLALAVKCASEARVDLLTIDGSSGGTGMSPWRMMNEWGIPTVYLECLLYDFLTRLKAIGAFIPSCAVGGGIALEDQVFKAIALGAPYIKAVMMGRATMAAAMVGKTVGKMVKEGKVSSEIKKYGENIEQIFVTATELRKKYGKDFDRIPPAAIGMYTYFDRLAVGLRQLMAGARKFSMNHISRDDLMALTREAADVSGIPYVMDADKQQVDSIFSSLRLLELSQKKQ